MTTDTTPAETYPWDADREPSAVYAASDRITASFFLRRDTPIEALDWLPDDRDCRVVVLRIGDLTFHFGLGDDEDAERIAVIDRLTAALFVLRDNAMARRQAVP